MFLIEFKKILSLYCFVHIIFYAFLDTNSHVDKRIPSLSSVESPSGSSRILNEIRQAKNFFNQLDEERDGKWRRNVLPC